MKYCIYLFLLQFSCNLQVGYTESTFHHDMNYCATEGRNHGKLSANCHETPKNILKNIRSAKFQNLCSKSFQISCIDAHQKIQCENGINVAKDEGNCEAHSSYSFRKCCNACKIGIEMKSTFDKCTNTTLILHDVIEACCNSTPLKIPTNDEEVPAKPDIENWCSRGLSLCNDETEICIDIQDYYQCDCKKGYQKASGTECTDIDECQEGSHNCSKYEICINEIGSYKCEHSECPLGFMPKYLDGVDGFECIDVDECLENPCGKDAICDNTFGNYSCEQRDAFGLHCADGYKEINGECLDIDECEMSICDGHCANLRGSYRCKKINCDVGYTKKSNINFTSCHCHNCKKLDHRPLRISYFFKVVESSDKQHKILTLEAPFTKKYKNFKLLKFDDKLFSFKEFGRGGYIVMKHVPEKDEEIKVEFDVYDAKKPTFRGKYLFIYYIYVNK